MYMNKILFSCKWEGQGNGLAEGMIPLNHKCSSTALSFHLSSFRMSELLVTIVT